MCVCVPLVVVVVCAPHCYAVFACVRPNRCVCALDMHLCAFSAYAAAHVCVTRAFVTPKSQHTTCGCGGVLVAAAAASSHMLLLH